MRFIPARCTGWCPICRKLLRYNTVYRHLIVFHKWKPAGTVAFKDSTKEKA